MGVQASFASLSKYYNKKSPSLNKNHTKPAEKDLQKLKSGSKVKNKEGKKLPNTATNIYNWFAISLALLLAGAVLYLVDRRKRKI